MAFIITNEKQDDYPAIRAIGSDEEVACAVYATLLNAALCTHVADGEWTNLFVYGFNETLLTTEWRSFGELANHIHDVHGVVITGQVG